MLYILFIQEKGLRRDYKKKQKKLCGFNYFYFAAQTAKNWIDLLAFTCCFSFFLLFSTLRGEIDIILEVLVVCLISWLGMVIGPLWHYDIGLIVVFLLSSWEFMVNCIVFLQGFRSFLGGCFYWNLLIDVDYMLNHWKYLFIYFIELWKAFNKLTKGIYNIHFL